MKHQITFIGGQLLPIYIGIKEFMPEKIHLIFSHETKDGIAIVKDLFKELSFTEFNCNPYDFFAIKKRIKNIIEKLDSDDSLFINLTGGTKIMLLAAQSVISEMQVKGFYINQNYSFIEIPSFDSKEIIFKLSIVEYFRLSGHKSFSAKLLSDFTPSDFKVSSEIESFSKSNKLYFKVTNFIRKKYKIVPEKGVEILANNTIVKWDSEKVEIHVNKVIVASFKSNNIVELFFNAAWWELIVASELSKWSKAEEIMLQCILPFKTDEKILKNEIDILLNTGNKLIFVECKSGYIIQEDINKMKIIKQTYGGIISKSLLVSRFIPQHSIMEKCKELDIEVYYMNAFQNISNPLSNINKILDKLDKKSSI